MQDRDALTQEMQSFLSRVRPASSSNALAELRVAFPDVNLCDRVRVCREWHDAPLNDAGPQHAG